MSETKWSNPHYTNSYTRRAYVGDAILEVRPITDGKWGWSILTPDNYGDYSDYESGTASSQHLAKREAIKQIRKIVEDMMQSVEELEAEMEVVDDQV